MSPTERTSSSEPISAWESTQPARQSGMVSLLNCLGKTPTTSSIGDDTDGYCRAQRPAVDAAPQRGYGMITGAFLTDVAAAFPCLLRKMGSPEPSSSKNERRWQVATTRSSQVGTALTGTGRAFATGCAEPAGWGPHFRKLWRRAGKAPGLRRQNGEGNI